MEKRKDIQIFELAYKKVPYGFWDNALYTPIQCGAATAKNKICELQDNTGDNISDKNYFYSETTGTYWIWKNTDTDFVGQCQYRRRLKFDEDTDFSKMLDKYRIITNTPMEIKGSIKRQMLACHPQIDYDAFVNIICKSFPEYKESVNYIFNNLKILFFSSSYVMRREDFERYCSFAFTVLERYFYDMGFENKDVLEKYVRERINGKRKEILSRPVNYHMLIGGFLQERLYSAWLLSNFDINKIKFVDFKFLENDIKVVHSLSL